MPAEYAAIPQQSQMTADVNSWIESDRPENRADDLRSANHFDRLADVYAAAYDECSASGHSFRARRDKALAMLGTGQLGTLLDVGGASGVYFHALKSRVDSYHIVDVSPLMISQAQRLDAGNVRLHCHLASAYALPFPDNSFDTVVAMGLLEYLDQPWKGLQEMARVTKPGGTVIASYPNAGSPMRHLSTFIYRFLRRPSPFSSSLVFSIADVRKQEASAKLKEICLQGYNAQVIPFPLTWRLRRFSCYLADVLEPLLGKFGNFWGTSFIVKCEKL